MSTKTLASEQKRQIFPLLLPPQRCQGDLALSLLHCFRTLGPPMHRLI